jgi:hypothetical protein
MTFSFYVKKSILYLLAIALILTTFSYPLEAATEPQLIPHHFLKAFATSERAVFEEAAMAVDGNSRTNWGTNAAKDVLPQSITINWPRPITYQAYTTIPGRISNRAAA